MKDLNYMMLPLKVIIFIFVGSIIFKAITEYIRQEGKTMKFFREDDLGMAELTTFGLVVSISGVILLANVFGYLIGGF